jgi:uncharacterized protein YktB (UPF0637 family)
MGKPAQDNQQGKGFWPHFQVAMFKNALFYLA